MVLELLDAEAAATTVAWCMVAETVGGGDRERLKLKRRMPQQGVKGEMSWVI